MISQTALAQVARTSKPALSVVDKPALVATLNLGKHKEHLRIWIEGARPRNHGFIKGESYTVTVSDCIKLELDPKGDRKVSGRTRNSKDIPIIELLSTEITEHCKGSKQVELHFTQGLIKIYPVKSEG